MKPRGPRTALLLALLLTSSRAWGAEPVAPVVDPPLPGGRVQDAALARAIPDEYAWQLFLALSRQALPGARGRADPAHPDPRSNAPDEPVVWETWAQVTGGRMPAGPHLRVPPSEVFPPHAAEPAPWAALSTEAPIAKAIEPILFEEIIDPVTHSGNTRGERSGNEVRISEPGYTYLREHRLYDFNNVRALARKRWAPHFPAGTQVIKAEWVRIRPEDEARYHWRTVSTTSGPPEIWGLSGLHLMTRDLPSWFWCDFEHVDFEEKALAPSRDSTTRGPGARHGHDGIRAELEGTPWASYRLRGTQIDYVDAAGKPVILANTQLEHTFQSSSSCMSCHARAGNDPRDMHVGQPSALKPFFSLEPARGPVGRPRAAWFKDFKGRGGTVGTDFLWSLVLRPERAAKKTKR